jgi:hypothetical protein
MLALQRVQHVTREFAYGMRCASDAPLRLSRNTFRSLTAKFDALQKR